MKPTQSTINLNVREQMSALADGQLAADELEQAMALCAQDPQAEICWHEYHLIGDALRAPQLLEKGGDMKFVDQFRSRLARESIQPEPVSVWPSAQEAANESIFRWKVTAGFASLAAVAALSWGLAGSFMMPGVQPQLAQLEQTNRSGHAQQVLVSSEQGTMVRDIRLEELLLAHQQFSPTPNVQVPADFVKQATFESLVK